MEECIEKGRPTLRNSAEAMMRNGNEHWIQPLVTMTRAIEYRRGRKAWKVEEKIEKEV